MHDGEATHRTATDVMIRPSAESAVRYAVASDRARLRTIGPALAAAVVLIATGFRLALVARGWPQLNSDEAVIGLMARNILYQHEYPLFYWGQYYLGPLQAYLAAGSFALLGPTPFALRLPDILLTGVFLWLVYAIGRIVAGEVAALLTLVWLAVGPAYALLREVTAIGGYQEMLVCAAGVLLLAWDVIRREPWPNQSRRGRYRLLLDYALIGLLSGIGFYATALILPALVAVAAGLAISRRRDLAGIAGIVLVLCFVEGAAPVLISGLLHPQATVSQLVARTQPVGVAHMPAGVTELVWQIGATLSVAVPALAGSPHVCVTAGNIWPDYPTSAASTVSAASACGTANVAYALLLLALLALSGWQLWRGTRVRHDSHASPTDAARHWLHAVLLATALLTMLAYALSPVSAWYQFVAARYMVLLYLAMPLIFGSLVRGATPLIRRLLARNRHISAGHVMSGGASALALAFMLGTGVAGGMQVTALAASQAYAQPPDVQVITFLEAHHQAAFYAEYWICYRIAFESGERLTCAVRGIAGDAELHLVNNRYQPYVQSLASVPHPAYVLARGSPVDAQFAHIVTAEHLPGSGYLRALVGAYAVYYYP